MKKVAVVTDSNSGITMEEASQLGIYLVPMPFFINGQQYYEGKNLTQEEFFQYQQDGAEISTSQPSIGEITEIWDSVLKEYEELVFLPMSSGLSGTCQTATMLSQDYDGKVQVINNQRISVTLRQSILDAQLLISKGYDAAGVKQILEREKMRASIYITVDTLRYLKKGGRITPTAAAIGTVLHIKPVLTIQGDKLDAFAKARGLSQAKKIMLKAMHDDLDHRFAQAAADNRIHMAVSYTGGGKEVEDWAAMVKKEFPDYDFYMAPLSLSIACHIGTGSLAIAMSEYIPEDDTL